MLTLVARVLVDDDHHAFAELVRHHQSTVRGLLRQLTRNDLALADDLAQETFLRVYKNLRSFRGEAKFSTWLYRIAYNVFAKTRDSERNWSGLTNQMEEEQDPKTVDPALRHDLMHALNCFRCMSVLRFYFAARMVYPMMKRRECWRFRSER